jgi:hypothetical protein
MPFSNLKSTEHACPCGCGSNIDIVEGRYEYQESCNVVFRSALFPCKSGEQHVWTQLGSGPWNEGDSRDCWITLHTWADSENLSTNLAEHSDSPFIVLFETKERTLTREEVFAQPGGKEWAFEVNDALNTKHQAISGFLLGQAGA